MHDPNHSITPDDAAAAHADDQTELQSLVQQEVRAELERARQARAQQAQQQPQARPSLPVPGFTISGNVAELATALAAAQAEFEPILKTKTADVQGTTKTGGAYKYSFDFAPLDEVKAKTMPALNRHGFAVLEPLYHLDARTYEMQVVLLHAAGEISCRLRIDDPGDIQKLGSAQTYRRRYLYTSLIGCVAESDDDGNAADGNAAQIQSRQPQHAPEPRRQAPPQAVSKAAQDQARPQQKPAQATQSPASGPPAASATVEAIQAEGRRLGLKGPALAANAKAYIGCTPDRLDLEGGEALAQQWLTALKAQKTAGEVEAK